MEKEIFGVPFRGASGKTVEDYYLESNNGKNGDSVLDAIWNLPSLIYIRFRLEEIFLRHNGTIPISGESFTHPVNKKSHHASQRIIPQGRTGIRGNISGHDSARGKERKNRDKKETE